MKRNKFNLSHYRLFSCDMGELIPCGLMEVLPGDTFQHSTSLLIRCSPLLAPIMHPVEVRMHHWFVPHRLVWENWEAFITGGSDGLDTHTIPTRSNNPTVGSLLDYLGLPTGTTNAPSALPLRGYNLIWNEFYRDPDLDTPAVVDTDDSDGSSTTLRNISWEKDYFTSARPWEQKGPAISIPLGTSARVKGIGTLGADPTFDIISGNIAESGGPDVTAANTDGNRWARSVGTDVVVRQGPGGAGNVPITSPNVFADLTGASAITINLLREAFALQRFEEARARYGSRYTEYLRYLGVRSSDARLARPEYLGGGKQTIQFSEVLQTAEGGTYGVGGMKGHGISAMRSNKYRRFFEEHGYVHSFFSCRPKTMYMNGVPRTFNRLVKEDFFQKELQHIGQQEILNKEVRVAHAAPTGVFGYQDRYDDYRRQWSQISGEFRSTLAHWHLARDFSSDPALNASFVSCVPSERVFAVPSADVLWIMARHSVQARRILSKTGTSGVM